MCFDLANPDSFENVKETWRSELQHFCPGVPVILVGTKLDLREDRETVDKLKRRRGRETPISYVKVLLLLV